jgi:hypothetical protein
MVEPAPVASPYILNHQTPTKTSTIHSNNTSYSSFSEHWVVAYGYRTTQEYHELMDRLTSYGKIVKQQSSNGRNNWFALQYEGFLSAEKALCGQPIILSTNSLCGTVRGSPELLQGLVGGGVGDYSPASGQNVFLSIEDEAHTTTNNTVVGGKSTYSSLKEEDILAYGSHGKTDRAHRRKSVCEKVVSWYFGWSDEHPHLD